MVVFVLLPWGSMFFSTKVSFFPTFLGHFSNDSKSQPKDPRRARRYCDICPPGTHIDEGHCERCEELGKIPGGKTKQQDTVGEVRWNQLEAQWSNVDTKTDIHLSPVYGNIYTCTYTLRIMHKNCACACRHIALIVLRLLYFSRCVAHVSLSLSLFLPIFSLSFLLTCCYMILCSHILYVDRYNYFLWCHCVSVHTRRYAYGHLAFQ